jgi:hypothetical protein
VVVVHVQMFALTGWVVTRRGEEGSCDPW